MANAPMGRKATKRVPSAAPDLLAALRNLRLADKRAENPYGHDCRWCHECIARAESEADAAISKAEGGQ